MDLSPIQKDILITLISLYQKHSNPIKGEEIAEVIKRNPGTIRNQMQALKAIGLVDGVPGPKGGYNPTAMAFRELDLDSSDENYDVRIVRNGEVVTSARVSEIDFTTLCHPDICHALIKLIGSAKIFEIGDQVIIGPTPVNKLLVRGEVYGKDEVEQSLLISTHEMISLPKKPIRHYMSSPLLSLSRESTLRDALHLFNEHHIHGAPVLDGDRLLGIVTLSDAVKAIDSNVPLTLAIDKIMTKDVVRASADVQLFEVINRFKEREIGRLIVMEGEKPIGILTQSDIIRVFPSL